MDCLPHSHFISPNFFSFVTEEISVPVSSFVPIANLLDIYVICEKVARNLYHFIKTLKKSIKSDTQLSLEANPI